MAAILVSLAANVIRPYEPATTRICVNASLVTEKRFLTLHCLAVLADRSCMLHATAIFLCLLQQRVLEALIVAPLDPR